MIINHSTFGGTTFNTHIFFGNFSYHCVSNEHARAEFESFFVSGMEGTKGFPLPLGAWDGLRYFIVALPRPSI